MSSLTFTRENALKYQLCMVGHLLRKQNEQLQSLMQTHQHRLDMRMVLNESPAVWEAMSEVLKPSTQVQSMERSIALQRQLVEFLKAKKKAIELMIEGNTDPKVNMFVKTTIL